MLKLPTWDFRTSRIEIGGKQLETKELILAGAMGVVIIAALVLAVVTFTRDPGKRTGTGVDRVFYYQCTACGFEFTTKEAPKVGSGVVADTNMPVDCPKCHAKGKAVAQTECQICHKYYLPSPLAGGPGDHSHVICPKCKGDITDWIQKNKKQPT